MRNEIRSYSINSIYARIIASWIEDPRGSPDEMAHDLWELIKESLSLNPLWESEFNRNVVHAFYFVKALCLTKNINNLVMWTHYTASHTGAIFIFKPASLESDFSKAKPVRYVDCPPTIFNGDNFPKYATGQIDLNDREFIRYVKNLIFLTKQSRWSYEEEWRVWRDYNEDDLTDISYRRFVKSELSEIIFGFRSERSFERECRSLVSDGEYANITWKRAIRDYNTQELRYIAA